VSKYAATHLDDIDELNDGRCPWRPVRHHFGISSFAVNSWTAHTAGDRIINEHDESEGEAHEELYFVATGRARFEVGGEQVDAPAGTFVFVPPAVTRTAFGEEGGTTILAIGGAPGRIYEPVGWEVWMPLNEAYREGRYDEVIERGRELVATSPYPTPLYNLACCESLAGHKDEAIEHLG
jgi:hypothetical protein